MNRAVLDTGPHDARLLLVGESGGKAEGAKGEAFVGPTAMRVKEIVEGAGLDWERDVRRANVIPLEMATLPKTPYAMQAVVRTHWSAIDESLSKGSHAAVLAYGRAALWRLAGRTKITDEHGGVYSIDVGGRSVPLVVSIHPAAVMRSKIEAGWTLVRAATERACRYASGIAFDGDRQRPTWERDHTGDKLRQLIMRARYENRPVAIDTEYDRNTRRPFIIGASCDGEHVISVTPTGDSLAVVRTLMLDATITKLLHHAPADVASLATLGVSVRAPVVDTLMMYATVFPDLPVGLERCSLHLFDHWRSWKGMAHDDPQYNAIDVAATWRLYSHLHPLMTARDLWGVWAREARHVGVLCMAMEARGLAVDPVEQRRAVTANDEARRRLALEVGAHVEVFFARRRVPYEIELEKVVALLGEIKLPRLIKDRDVEQVRVVGELRKRRDRCKTVIARWTKGFDLGNNDHLRWLLYDVDGFKLPIQRKEGRPTANADAIARLLALKKVQETPAIQTVLVGVKEYQHLEKMTNTFLLWREGHDEEPGQPSAAVDIHGVAHPEYRPFGTGTGRLAGGPDSDLGDRKVNAYAYNALNIPEETRRIYVPHAPNFDIDTATITTEIIDDDAEDELVESNLSSVQ